MLLLLKRSDLVFLAFLIIVKGTQAETKSDYSTLMTFREFWAGLGMVLVLAADLHWCYWGLGFSLAKGYCQRIMKYKKSF